MKYLVIGDTGMVGQALMKTGNASNFEMHGISRRSTDLSLDALDVEALNNVLDYIDPDAVINVAGLIDVNACERTPCLAWKANARLPSVLAAACALRDIKLVQVSTDHYYTGDGKLSHDEADPVVLLNEYARTKYAGEFMALTCPEALVIRTNVVGFRGWTDRPTFVEWLLTALETKTPIELYSDFHTSSISANYLAEAIFRLLRTNAKGVLNVASSEGASKLEFARALAGACGIKMCATKEASILSAQNVRRAESLVLETKRAEILLGEKLPSLKMVAQDLAKEYKSRQL